MKTISAIHAAELHEALKIVSDDLDFYSQDYTTSYMIFRHYSERIDKLVKDIEKWQN